MSQLKYDPQDIKAIAYPVDLIVFDGLNTEGRVKNVILVARSKAPGIRGIRRSIENAVSDGRFIWETVRVQVDGTVDVASGESS